MRHKDNWNPLILKSPELHLSYRYRRFRQAGVRSRKVCSILFALLLISVFPEGALSGPKGPAEMPPPLVTVAKVTEQDVNPPAEYVGHMEAVQTVDLRARIEGFLEQVKFKEGSYVRAGDLLYVIEQTPYQAKFDADTASVTQATATFTKARQYLERVRTVRSGGVSATDIDDAVAEELRARAGLEEAKATRPGIHYGQGANNRTHRTHSFHQGQLGESRIRTSGQDCSDRSHPCCLFGQRKQSCRHQDGP